MAEARSPPPRTPPRRQLGQDEEANFSGRCDPRVDDGFSTPPRAWDRHFGREPLLLGRFQKRARHWKDFRERDVSLWADRLEWGKVGASARKGGIRLSFLRKVEGPWPNQDPIRGRQRVGLPASVPSGSSPPSQCAKES